MPAEAVRPCSLYVLPTNPTQLDLEAGYATRGAQLVACNAARDLAVRTHEAEHALGYRADEDEVTVFVALDRSGASSQTDPAPRMSLLDRLLAPFRRPPG